MNTLFILLVLVSGISFIIYGCLLLISPKMKNEFIRFDLEKFAKLTGLLELIGGTGMIVGLWVSFILLMSSGGLALLMLLGFGVRLKMRDGFWVSLPSFFFMILNLYIILLQL